MQLQQLLDQHSFWATGRSKRELRNMLRGSQIAVSAWQGRQLVGFGRATSDGVFRAVLWDVVVATDQQGQGLGRKVVTAIMEDKAMVHVERIYVMTTQQSGFYRQLDFEVSSKQQLMLKQNPK